MTLINIHVIVLVNHDLVQKISVKGTRVYLGRVSRKVLINIHHNRN